MLFYKVWYRFDIYLHIFWNPIVIIMSLKYLCMHFIIIKQAYSFWLSEKYNRLGGGAVLQWSVEGVKEQTVAVCFCVSATLTCENHSSIKRTHILHRNRSKKQI